MKTTAIATKTVKVLARVEFKNDSRKVCYIVRSSNGNEQYITCLFQGKACSCTCKGYQKFHKCYHASQVEAKEAARSANLATIEEEKRMSQPHFFTGMSQVERENAASALRMSYQPW